MAIISDFGRFVLAVVRRWQAYVTGSIFTAAAFLYEHLSGKIVSANIALCGAAAFFVAGAFMAWREQYRSDRAVEFRDRVDAFISRGEWLYEKWKNNHRPKLRTKQWLSATHSFVRRNFSLSQFDAFTSHPMGLGDEDAMRQRIKTYFDFKGRDEQDHELASGIVTRVDALRTLRAKITE